MDNREGSGTFGPKHFGYDIEWVSVNEITE